MIESKLFDRTGGCGSATVSLYRKDLGGPGRLERGPGDLVLLKLCFLSKHRGLTCHGLIWGLRGE